MIIANNVSLAFGTQTVFDKISFTLHENQRVGLVGRNGSGKSTLLEVIAGIEALRWWLQSPLTSKKRIAYLPQEVVLDSKKTILEETLSAFEKLYILQQELR